MIVQAVNNTLGTLTYSAEGITIPASSTITVSPSVLVAFSIDPNVISDIRADNLRISDSVTTYNGDAAIAFLKEAANYQDTLDKSSNGLFTDRSGTATGTSTQIIPINTSRKYLFIQNLGNQAIYFNFTNAATAGSGSISLSPLQSYVLEGSFVSSEAVFMIKGTGPNQPFTAKEG